MTKKKNNKSSAEKTIRNIRRNGRRKYSGEEKIRIVLEELLGEESIVDYAAEKASARASTIAGAKNS